MARRRRCANLAWRDEDPSYIAERKNDRIVFRKIKREAERTAEHPFAVVRRISRSPLWAGRLKGKSPESWKRAYNKWRSGYPKNWNREAVHTAPNVPPHLYKCGGKGRS